MPEPESATIQDTVTLTGNAVEGQKQVTASAQINHEYVASGEWNWALNYLRSLSFAVDDVTRDFGDDLYERMMLDGQVSSSVHTFKMAVLEQGLSVTPAVDAFLTDEQGRKTPNPKFKKAKKLAEFIERQLAELCGSFNPDTASALYWAVYDLCDAFAFGNRVAEIVLDDAKEGVDAGKYCLKALKVKPRRTAAFVVDAYNSLVGVLGLIAGQPNTALVQGVVLAAGNISNLLPRKKFAVLSFRPRNGDPRGQSLLRPVYDPWFVKQQIKQERLRWLAQLAGGCIVGETAPEAKEVALYDDSGEWLTDSNGLPVTMAPEDAMVNQMMQLRNGAVMAVPNGAKVTINYPDSDSPFDAALDRQDKEIAVAILGQTRMTMESEHGSKADSQTGQDVFGLLARHGRIALLTMLYELVALLVEINFGRDALSLCPRLSLSGVEHQDFAEMATAIGGLYQAGYLAPSQLPETDQKLGLPIRQESELQPQQTEADAGSDAETDTNKDNQNAGTGKTRGTQRPAL